MTANSPLRVKVIDNFLKLPVLEMNGRSITTLHNVCAVHREMFSTPGDIMSTVGDIMSTVEDIMGTVGGYHEYTGGISWVHWGDIIINGGKVIGKTIKFVWRPQCTEHPPVYP